MCKSLLSIVSCSQRETLSALFNVSAKDVVECLHSLDLGSFGASILDCAGSVVVVLCTECIQ